MREPRKHQEGVTFRKQVYDHYRSCGRHDLPWRKNPTPYRVLVSEVMLQQTQVERVIPKYRAFLRRFPSVTALARAPLADVLRLWQGLGYNRRARALHECAKVLTTEYHGRVPKELDTLVTFPGIGRYTAGAVLAFAYSIPVPLIETNIRAVFLHHFFPGRSAVADAELMPLIEATLDYENPRRWYAALMDYGAHLKRMHGSQNKRSRHYTKQSPFEGSDRQLRGAILRELAVSEASLSEEQLERRLSHESRRIAEQLSALTREGLVSRTGRTYMLG